MRCRFSGSHRLTGDRVNIEELSKHDRSGRLARRLLGISETKPGGPDLIALVRSVAVGLGYKPVEVPSVGGWPLPAEWKAASFSIEDLYDEADLFRVTPLPWSPGWAGVGESPDGAAARREPRRRQESITGDPYLFKASGGKDYFRSTGQRDATRAVLSSQPGATVLAVLPTGAGKTVVATVAAFLSRPRLTVMVVPTVSLALDLERRFKDEYEIDSPVAYHGGLTADEKLAFKERMKSGSQWIVVTSPEAMLTSLSMPLHQIASEGRLANLVIDEAHIVAAWGGSFRPAFQALAGFRRHLLNCADHAGQAFRTILLTGTLDTYGLRVLERLFSEEKLTLVASQTTRPEPSYWVAKCGDEEGKRAQILDALRHLPRPAIVYTSLVDGTGGVKASEVAQWLKNAGFGRVALVTGGMARSIRESAVQRIRCELREDEDVDVVVASSAFGLGVDIDDVRSIVHACIPESIDRYYQEVGRGGRDGLASVSIVVHEPRDRTVATGLAKRQDIGSEKGWERWKSMLGGATDSTDGLSVSLRSIWNQELDPTGERNRSWNLHTLTLMELAGMVRLGWRNPPPPSDQCSEDEINDHFQSHYNDVPLNVLQADLTEDVFKKRLDAVRANAIGSGSTALNSVLGLLKASNECHNEKFADSFSLDLPNGDRAMVEVSCGGCPACRSRNLEPKSDSSSNGIPYWSQRPPEVPNKIRPLFKDGTMASICYATQIHEGWMQVGPLVQRLLKNGVQLLVLPVGESDNMEKIALESGAKWFALDTLTTWSKGLDPPALVTAVVLRTDPEPEVVRKVLDRRNGHVPIIVIHQHDLKVPNSKHLVREWIPSLDLSDALRRF